MWVRVDRHLIWGPKPDEDVVEYLVHYEDVKLFVSLIEDVDYEEKVRELGVDLIVYPIEDFSFAPIEDVHFKVLSKLLEYIERGEKCYVHCLAGIGRSGTLVALYLVNQGYTCNKARKLVKSMKIWWPESEIQWIAPAWYERLLSKKIGLEFVKKCYDAILSKSLDMEERSSRANICLDICNALKLRTRNSYKVAYLAGLVGELEEALRERNKLSNIIGLASYNRILKILKAVKFRGEFLNELTESDMKIAFALAIARAIGNAYREGAYGGCELSDDKLTLFSQILIEEEAKKEVREFSTKLKLDLEVIYSYTF